MASRPAGTLRGEPGYGLIVAQVVRRKLFLPTWLPIACWPLLVVLALGGGFLGGAAAATAAMAAIAVGIGLVWGASGLPEPAGPDAAASAESISSEPL